MLHIMAPYRVVLGSDAERDGLSLALERAAEGRRDTLLEVFRSDTDGTLTFNALEACEVPLEVLESFLAHARRELGDPSAASEA